MAQTASNLSNVLREEWFKKNIDDLRQQTHRQVYSGSTPFIIDPNMVGNQMYVTSSPKWIRGQDQVQLAASKRKGKSSYRQRQKNGRAGRK